MFCSNVEVVVAAAGLAVVERLHIAVELEEEEVLDYKSIPVVVVDAAVAASAMVLEE